MDLHEKLKKAILDLDEKRIDLLSVEIFYDIENSKFTKDNLSMLWYLVSNYRKFYMHTRKKNRTHIFSEVLFDFYETGKAKENFDVYNFKIIGIQSVYVELVLKNESNALKLLQLIKDYMSSQEIYSIVNYYNTQNNFEQSSYYYDILFDKISFELKSSMTSLEHMLLEEFIENNYDVLANYFPDRFIDIVTLNNDTKSIIDSEVPNNDICDKICDADNRCEIDEKNNVTGADKTDITTHNYKKSGAQLNVEYTKIYLKLKKYNPLLQSDLLEQGQELLENIVSSIIDFEEYFNYLKLTELYIKISYFVEDIKSQYIIENNLINIKDSILQLDLSEIDRISLALFKDIIDLEFPNHSLLWYLTCNYRRCIELMEYNEDNTYFRDFLVKFYKNGDAIKILPKRYYSIIGIQLVFIERTLENIESSVEIIDCIANELTFEELVSLLKAHIDKYNMCDIKCSTYNTLNKSLQSYVSLNMNEGNHAKILSYINLNLDFFKSLKVCDVVFLDNVILDCSEYVASTGAENKSKPVRSKTLAKDNFKKIVNIGKKVNKGVKRRIKLAFKINNKSNKNAKSMNQRDRQVHNMTAKQLNKYYVNEYTKLKKKKLSSDMHLIDSTNELMSDIHNAIRESCRYTDYFNLVELYIKVKKLLDDLYIIAEINDLLINLTEYVKSGDTYSYETEMLNVLDKTEKLSSLNSIGTEIWYMIKHYSELQYSSKQEFGVKSLINFILTPENRVKLSESHFKIISLKIIVIACKSSDFTSASKILDLVIDDLDIIELASAMFSNNYIYSDDSNVKRYLTTLISMINEGVSSSEISLGKLKAIYNQLTNNYSKISEYVDSVDITIINLQDKIENFEVPVQKRNKKQAHTNFVIENYSISALKYSAEFEKYMKNNMSELDDEQKKYNYINFREKACISMDNYELYHDKMKFASIILKIDYEIQYYLARENITKLMNLYIKKYIEMDFDNLDLLSKEILDLSSSVLYCSRFKYEIWHIIRANINIIHYRKDSTLTNETCDYYTEFFLDYKKRNLFDSASRVMIISQLITSNREIHSINKSIQLFDLIFYNLELTSLTNIIFSYLSSVFSSIDKKKHVEPWLSKLEIFLRMASTSDNSPRNFEVLNKTVKLHFEKMVSIDEERSIKIVKQFDVLEEKFSKNKNSFSLFKSKNDIDIKRNDDIAEMTAYLSELTKGIEFSNAETFRKIKELEDNVHEKIANFDNYLDSFKYLGLFYSAKRHYRVFDIHRKVNEAVECVTNPLDYDKILFVANIPSVFMEVGSIPIMLYARMNGFRTVPMCAPGFDYENYNDDLSVLSKRICRSEDLKYPENDLNYEWIIDVDNKYIGFDNINCYQSIYEWVSRIQFSFFIDKDSPFTKAKINQAIKLLDVTFNYLEEVNKYVLDSKKEAYIVGTSSHFSIGSAYRIFCESHLNTAKLEYIGIGPGYETYFNNMSDIGGKSLACLNLTRNLESRAVFLGNKILFEKFYEANKNNREMLEKVEEWLSHNRASSGSDASNDAKIEKLILEKRNNNQKVFLALGKVVFDLAVKDTKGIIHEDMSDWITNTVDIIRDTDSLLLIKPHPHEENKYITLTESECMKFVDLIKTEIPENVIILDSQRYRTVDLIEMVDAVLMWNGTSCVEQASQGNKVFTFDTWSFKDYPIGLYKVKSTKEYERILRGDIPEYDVEELLNRARIFLNYMGSDDVMVKTPMIKYSTVNFHTFTETEVYIEEVKKYIENGSHSMDLMFSRAFNMIEE